MIHEYAIEPTVLLQWASNKRDYAEFLREYGLGTPRIISSFPKRKVSKLRSYLLKQGPVDEQSSQGRRYMEMVTKLIEEISLRELPGQQGEGWSETAKIEHGRVPFDIILSTGQIDVDRNITPESMYEQDSIWDHQDQISIRRTNIGFLQAVSNLIRLSSKRIVIVDTFGWRPEAIGFVQFLINALPNNRPANDMPSVTLFYKERRGSRNTGSGTPNAAYVKSQIVEGLESPVSGVEINVAELREQAGNDVFHNRCIFTELGGVLTGHGISISGNEEHTDDATLMRPPIYQKKWKQFVEENCFEIVTQA